MIRDFLQRRKEFDGGKGKELSMNMEQPELSLAPSFSTNYNYMSGSDINSFKGKQQMYLEDQGCTADLELQLCDPLPLDWEQCLDLQSGRMYYVNRKTSKKTWTRPKDLDLNLDLNISPYPDSDQDNNGNNYVSPKVYPKRQKSWCSNSSINSNGGTDSNGMVAVVCVNCHLLIMLSKSSPYCPNCKSLQSPNVETVKSLETLSLLH
ncbi:hypothetical protein LUZ60_004462 [Juncus effusus]|nr:hypothetical protein LUZ60_004462 [Juncus effusus]